MIRATTLASLNSRLPKKKRKKERNQHSPRFLFRNKAARTQAFKVPKRDFHLHAVRGVAEQASESDGVGDRAQVDEQDGGERLDVQRVVEVAGEERQLALDIQDEATAEPAGGAASWSRVRNPRFKTLVKINFFLSQRSHILIIQ